MGGRPKRLLFFMRAWRLLDLMFLFSRWMRLLLYFRPTRPKKLLRSPPPLLEFPVSKASVRQQCFILSSVVVQICETTRKHFFCFFYRLSILKPASPMEKEKKKLNIEKPKTLKTLQNDKSFLKKNKVSN